MFPTLRKRLINKRGLLLALLLALLVLPAYVSGQDDERQRIVNKVPRHVPLKIQIVNNGFDSKLQNASIKMTNTSEKPIYSLVFHLITPNDFPKINGHRSGLSSNLTFGARHLEDVTKFATGSEESLKPGDSITFDIDDKEARLFEEFLQEKGITEPPRLALLIQVLSFGDGTGFLTTGAVKYPSEKKAGTGFYRSASPDFFPRSRAE
jgi:hypothetical protein